LFGGENRRLKDCVERVALFPFVRSTVLV